MYLIAYENQDNPEAVIGKVMTADGMNAQTFSKKFGSCHHIGKNFQSLCSMEILFSRVSNKVISLVGLFTIHRIRCLLVIMLPNLAGDS